MFSTAHDTVHAEQPTQRRVSTAMTHRRCSTGFCIARWTSRCILRRTPSPAVTRGNAVSGGEAEDAATGGVETARLAVGATTAPLRTSRRVIRGSVGSCDPVRARDPIVALLGLGSARSYNAMKTGQESPAPAPGKAAFKRSPPGPTEAVRTSVGQSAFAITHCVQGDRHSAAGRRAFSQGEIVPSRRAVTRCRPKRSAPVERGVADGMRRRCLR